jgi:hypothetical protein
VKHNLGSCFEVCHDFVASPKKLKLRHFDPAKAGSGLPEMRRNLAFSSRIALPLPPEGLSRRIHEQSHDFVTALKRAECCISTGRDTSPSEAYEL